MINLFDYFRLFQAIERDVRRTSADPDENDLLHEALNRLTTLLSSLLTRTLGTSLHKKIILFLFKINSR
jgi:hypothetical protein